MPALMPVADHEGRSSYRLTDKAVVNQLAAGLDSRTQEGVGGTAEHQPFFRSQLHQLLPVRKRKRQRLLDIDMLTGQQRLLAYVEMPFRRSQIDHNLNIRRSEQLLRSPYIRHTVFLRSFLCPLLKYIRAGINLRIDEQLSQILKINPAYIPAADNPDLYLIQRNPTCSLLILIAHLQLYFAAHTNPLRMSSFASGMSKISAW
ncbi:hypothetical protein D3C75_762750 [compost metagenome]